MIRVFFIEYCTRCTHLVALFISRLYTALNHISFLIRNYCDIDDFI